jgi:hypothetical protein
LNFIDPLGFIILALATFRITRLFTTDYIFEWLRNGIWKKFPPHTWLGYLFTCDWCFSIWVASGIAICYTIVPMATTIVALPFALSAVASLISKRLDD